LRMSFGENCIRKKETYPLYSPFIVTGRTKRQNRAINLHLYHYAGNNPMRYNDPDGRITKHTDLKGPDRIKAELKDIAQGSLKYGLFAGGSLTLWEVVNLGAEVDLGSVEVSGSLNNDVKTEESNLVC